MGLVGRADPMIYDDTTFKGSLGRCCPQKQSHKSKIKPLSCFRMQMFWFIQKGLEVGRTGSHLNSNEGKAIGVAGRSSWKV